MGGQNEILCSKDQHYDLIEKSKSISLMPTGLISGAEEEQGKAGLSVNILWLGYLAKSLPIYPTNH